MKRFNSALFLAVVVLLGLALMAQAATYTNAVGGYGYSPKDWNTYVVANTLDISSIPTGGTNYQYGLSASNTVAMINIRSNSWVHGVYWKILDDGTNTVGTFDVGDGTTANSWLSNVTLTNGCTTISGYASPAFPSITYVTGTVTYVVAETGYTLGKFYTANDSILFRADHPIGTGKVLIRAIVSDVGQDPY